MKTESNIKPKRITITLTAEEQEILEAACAVPGCKTNSVKGWAVEVFSCGVENLDRHPQRHFSLGQKRWLRAKGCRPTTTSLVNFLKNLAVKL